MSGGSQTKDTAQAIQALRAFAALAVVADHALLSLVEKAGASHIDSRLAYSLGQVGVEAFFVISGVVMVLAHSGDFGRREAIAAFVRKRLTRIIPLYWLATGLYVLKLRVQGAPPATLDLLRSFLFVPYVNSDGLPHPVYGLGWTLNYEMFFYGLLAVGLLTTRFRAILGTGAVLVVLVAFGEAGMLRGAVLNYWANPIVLLFPAGMILGALRTNGSRLPLGMIGGSLVALTLAGCGVAALAKGHSLLAGCAAFGAAGICALSREHGQTRLPGRILAELGAASYSIYLTHSFIVGPAARAAGKAGVTSPALFLAFALCASAAGGVLVYRFIERPLLRVLNKGLIAAGRCLAAGLRSRLVPAFGRERQ